MEINEHIRKLISIHALREEGDRIERQYLHQFWNFYPRPPRGGRHTLLPAGYVHDRFLSTPSARRATVSGRRSEMSRFRFLSTPSARRATRSMKYNLKECFISIHALREEGDCT